jgi:hypothetical protein
MMFGTKARVQVLVSLFDAGTEDAQGRTYSQKRSANGGLGDYCLETITRSVYRRGGRNAAQKYMVKCDEGTSTAIEERHLTLVEEADAASATTADDEASGMSHATERYWTTRVKT